LEPRFTGSNLAEDDGFLRAIRMHSMTSFRGEVKPWPRVARSYGMLKNPVKYERYILLAKFTTISCQVYPDLLRGVSAGTCHRTLMDESGMIRNQMGMHNRSEKLAVLGTLCMILPLNSNQ
jgi:hypothetical protein